MSSNSTSAGLEDAVRLLQLVVDNMPQFVFWKNRESVYLGCNEAFARVAGVGSAAEVVGKTDFELAWKREEAEFFRTVDERVMASGRPEYHILEPQNQSDGKQAWLDTNKIPLRDEDGTVTGILGTFEDVTARIAEQESVNHKQRLESIGKLAGGVAHDFNNLLGGIIGAAEVLQRRAGDQGDRDLLQEILRTAERAADLTSKLLAFSRRGNMQDEVLDLHDAIDNVAPLLRRGLDVRIEVRFELEAEHSCVKGDASEIELALLNLGLNARDAMPQGGVLTISTRDTHLTEAECVELPFSLTPGPYVRIAVEDTGAGVPLEARDRVFEPFFTTKETGAGTGLGLAAVYGTVQAHHGAIVLDTEKRGGARFLIDLPVVDETVSGRPETSASPQVLATGLALVVDDESLMRRTTAERLGGLGFDVLTAESGEEALEIFQANQANLALVLIDVVMSGIGGVEAARRMRAGRRDVPIILASGFTPEQLVGREEDTRTMAFLRKPYAHAMLVRAIEEANAIANEG